MLNKENLFFKIGSVVIALSPSLMILISISWIKSNHASFYPDFSELAWFEILVTCFAAFWQLCGVYALITYSNYEVYLETKIKNLTEHERHQARINNGELY
jgi:hypothetical protein